MVACGEIHFAYATMCGVAGLGWASSSTMQRKWLVRVGEFFEDGGQPEIVDSGVGSWEAEERDGVGGEVDVGEGGCVG